MSSKRRHTRARWALGLFLPALSLLAACGSGEDEPIALCRPPQQQSPDRVGLYDPTPTTCDDESNRAAQAGTPVANKIEDANAREFPKNVVANPAACLNPEVEGTLIFANPALNAEREQLANELAEPEAAEEAETETDEEAELDVYSVFEAGAFLVHGDVGLAVDAIVTAAAVEGLTADAFEAIPLEVDPEDPAASVDRPTLVRPKDLDPLAIDPLSISNQINRNDPSDLGFEIRPNYIFMRAPGAQHSPANEPVPAFGNLSNDNATAEPNRSLPAVDILDSDFNHIVGSPDRMRLSAGHLTFVRGVLEELTPRFPMQSFDFAVGDELDQYLSEWELVSILLDSEAGLGVRPFPDVLNLSAGGYVCKETNRSVPSGTETAIEILRTRSVVLVAAAGNDGQIQPPLPFWPAAAADFEEFGDLVIGVKAVDHTGAIARFSNPKPKNAACALGVDVRSSFPAGEYAYSSTVDDNGNPGIVGVFKGAAVWSGTSFATPNVTAQLLSELAKLDIDFNEPGYRDDPGYIEARQELIEGLKNNCPDS